MLVTRIIGACPDCKTEAAFGNVMVADTFVLRGCRRCKYSEKIPLPDLSKKLIYLDQFFFSAAFRDKDKRFAEIGDLIRKATAHQLLLAPYSSIHEDETHQWRGWNGKTKDELMEFIKATSRGHDFEPSYRVERDQVVQAFRSFFTDEPVEHRLCRKTALRSKVDVWEDYFRIEVGSYRGDVELIRDLKEKSVEQLVDAVFPNWLSSNESFDEQVKLECGEAAKAYIRLYLGYAARVMAGDYMANFDSPVASMIVQDMLIILPDSMTLEDRVAKVKAFFASPHFLNIPHEWISSRMFAVLREQVRGGAYRTPDDAKNRLSGFFQDVKHVSMYAPYVDAIVVDRAIAAILNDGRLDFAARYGTRIFSLANWDEFGAWLQGLIDSETDEHRDALLVAYP